MIKKTHMTIDAYLKQAGLKTNSLQSPKTHTSLKHGAGSRFTQVIDRMVSANQSTNQSINPPTTGMTVADYLKRRVVCSETLSPTQSIGPKKLSPHPHCRHPATLPKKNAETTDSSLPSITAKAAPAQPPNDEDVIVRSIRQAAEKYNLSEKLIASIIRAESNFQIDAVSPAGAQGLMQLMPATARDLGVSDPFDVQQNIDGGAKYIRQMLDRFGGDVKSALAAYNAGPGTVERYNGDVPYQETRQYIQRVLSGMESSGQIIA